MRKGSAIVGIGETRVGKHPGRNALELQSEAVQRALADARLEKDDIDELYTLASYVSPILMHGLSMAEYLGIRPRYQANCDIGGTPAFMVMVEQAMEAIEDGRSDVAVCVYGDNPSTSRAQGSHGFVHSVAQGTEDWEDPFGCSVLSSYALLCRRYLDKYDLDPEKVLFPVMRAARRHAALNDNAAYPKPITIEDYRESKMIADPLRRLDSSPVVDGAGAFVIASKRKMKKRKSPHVPVTARGIGIQNTHKIVSQIPDIEDLGLADAAKRAFSDAGISHRDVDLMTMHDGFTHSVLLALEAVGFCKPGKAGEFVAAGGIDPGGELPLNTHGGLLAQGHVGGVLHVLEAVRQLRGEAGQRQVKDAEVAVVAGAGGILSICGAMVLAKGTE